MRLLNTSTLQFRNFDAKSCPPYAILSHRWGVEEDEPTYQDYRKNRKQETNGHKKILDFCKLAQSLGLDWGWVDTVCIDKKSSAELSEAINSMFAWYKRSACCLTFLDDVEINSPDELSSLQRSAWFTRGWTLQELLAPGLVFFYDKNWKLIGSKCDTNLTEPSIKEIRNAMRTQLSLTDLLSATTGIARQYLTLASSIKQASVAQRMSWASRRITTREEDGSYSLLGLFGVNMPLLYGEGGVKAFQRLQREIIELSNDESIFAFSTVPDVYTQMTPSWDWTHVGPLARWHLAFRNSSAVRRCNIKESLRQPPYKMTNRGLELTRPSWKMTSDDTWAFGAFPGLRGLRANGKNARIIKLACTDRQNQRYDTIACYIFVVQDGSITETNQWFRVMPAAGKTLVIDPGMLERKKLLANQLFYIGSFLELDDDGPSVDWSIRRRTKDESTSAWHSPELHTARNVDQIPPARKPLVIDYSRSFSWIPDEEIDGSESKTSPSGRPELRLERTRTLSLGPTTAVHSDELSGEARQKEVMADSWAPPAPSIPEKMRNTNAFQQSASTVATPATNFQPSARKMPMSRYYGTLTLEESSSDEDVVDNISCGGSANDEARKRI